MNLNLYLVQNVDDVSQSTGDEDVDDSCQRIQSFIASDASDMHQTKQLQLNGIYEKSLSSVVLLLTSMDAVASTTQTNIFEPYVTLFLFLLFLTCSS